MRTRSGHAGDKESRKSKIKHTHSCGTICSERYAKGPGSMERGRGSGVEKRGEEHTVYPSRKDGRRAGKEKGKQTSHNGHAASQTEKKTRRAEESKRRGDGAAAGAKEGKEWDATRGLRYGRVGGEGGEGWEGGSKGGGAGGWERRGVRWEERLNAVGDGMEW